MRGVVAWLGVVDKSPVPQLASGHSVAVRHPETGHRVENLARQLDLNSLPLEASTSHTSTDDRLVSIHGILDQAASAMTGRRVPLTSS